MALAAKQLGSGLLRQTSRPEIAQAIVLPLTFGSSEMTNIRPVRIV